MRPLSFWIGTALLSLGVIILLVVGGIYAYGLYEELDYQNSLDTTTAVAPLEASLATPDPPTATAAPTGTPRPSATPEAIGRLPEATSPPSTPTATPEAQMEASPGILADSPQEATRIKAPAIKLDAPVAESIISNNQWVVPKFAAGHLQGTAQPGGPGNAVFAGHVSSIASGNVFSSIGKLAPGDDVVIVTDGGDLHYQVTERTVVKNTDLSVTKDFGDERVTLITCTGRWLPLQRDFNQRIVVVAVRVA